jgi:hypothetical protein
MSTDGEAGGVKRKNVFLLAVLFLVWLSPLLLIWSYEYLPIQDYPNHFARLHILSGYNQSDFYRENFLLKPFKGISPLPHMALDLFVLKMVPFLSIDTAMRLFISLYIILFLIGIILLSSQFKISADVLLLVYMPLAYSSFFFLGLINFVFSIPLFLFSILIMNAYESKKNKLYILLLGLISIIMYLVHIFAFFILCIFISVYAVARRMHFRECVYFFVAISLPLIFSINYVLMGTAQYDMVRKPFIDKVAHLGFHFRHYPKALLILSSVVFTVALYLVFRRSVAVNRPYFYSIIVLLSVYFFLPFAGMNSNYIDVRAVFFSFILLPLAFRHSEHRLLKTGKMLLFVVVLMNLFWCAAFFRNFDRNFSVNCAVKLESESSLLPIDATLMKGEITPYVHSWGYFYRFRELLTPYVFAGGQQQIEYKNELPAPPEFWVLRLQDMRKEFPEIITHFTGYYDYILLFGGSPEVKTELIPFSKEICSDGIVSLYKIKSQTKIRPK